MRYLLPNEIAASFANKMRKHGRKKSLNNFLLAYVVRKYTLFLPIRRVLSTGSNVVRIIKRGKPVFKYKLNYKFFFTVFVKF